MRKLIFPSVLVIAGLLGAGAAVGARDQCGSAWIDQCEASNNGSQVDVGGTVNQPGSTGGFGSGGTGGSQGGGSGGNGSGTGAGGNAPAAEECPIVGC